jgi:hypothetical protein
LTKEAHTEAKATSLKEDMIFHSILHSRLVNRWQRASSDLTKFIFALALIFPGWIGAIIIQAAGSGCMNVGPVLCVVYGLVGLSMDLLVVAASNEGPGRASVQYRRAGKLLREWTGRARYQGDEKLAEEMADWRRMLESFGDLDAVRAKLFGFGVDWALLRSLVVSLVTLAIAM